MVPDAGLGLAPASSHPVMEAFHRLAGRALEGERQEVIGSVYAADCDANGRWGCVVSCPAIFGANKRISGIDAEQSLELAEWFLIDQWNHHGLQPKLDQIELTYAARVR